MDFGISHMGTSDQARFGLLTTMHGGRSQPGLVLRDTMAVDMRTQYSLLKDLQSIDLAIYRITTDIDELPQQIADLEREYGEVKGLFESLTKELSAVESARRREESDLAASTEEMRQREAKLYAIKTNKEYQAAIKEIASAKKQNREREDRILQAMERIEALTQKKTQLEKEFADKEASYRERSRELEKQEAVLRQQIAEVNARRPAVLAEIDVKILRQYEFIRRRHPDAAVAVVKGVCNGCHMNVPPQLYNEILRSQEMKNCPSCHRLIYTEDATGT